MQLSSSCPCFYKNLSAILSYVTTVNSRVLHTGLWPPVGFCWGFLRNLPRERTIQLRNGPWWRESSMTPRVRWPLDFISWRDRKQSGQKVEPAKEKPKILSLIPQGSLPLVRYHLPHSINWRPSVQTPESTEIITFKPGAHMIQTQLTQATANLLTVD